MRPLNASASAWPTWTSGFADFWEGSRIAGGGSDGKTLAGVQLADGSWNVFAAGWPFGDSAYILYDSDTGAATW